MTVANGTELPSAIQHVRVRLHVRYTVTVHVDWINGCIFGMEMVNRVLRGREFAQLEPDQYLATTCDLDQGSHR